tara:strand:+ start:4434 stop:5255 length:822 start_codon:yes stop_codon:yes gene_type:complete
LKEPLYHFLFAGLLVFLVFWLSTDSQNDIVISQAEVQRMSTMWESQWRRPPSKDELQRIIDLRIREEVLAREAITRGLIENDSVVRRRLAQKIENFESDVASMAEPSDETLIPYFESNLDRYEIPAVVMFRHHYFSSDRRGAAALADAEREISTLIAIPTDQRELMGDTFHEGHDFEASLPRLARVFGDDFALALEDSITTASIGTVVGPIPSPYGAHIVELQHYVPKHLPALTSIRDQVLTDWRLSQVENTKDRFYTSIRDKYRVTVAGPSD